MNEAQREERRQMVVIGGSVAAASAGALASLKRFPWVIWPYGVFLLFCLGFVMTRLVKIRQQKRRAEKGGRA